MSDNESRAPTESDPESERASATAPPEPVRHSFGLELTAVLVLTVLVLLLFRVGAVSLVLTGIFTFFDAWYAGIRKRAGKPSFFNLSPAGWAAGVFLLLLVAYPLYAWKRNQLKTTDGNIVFFVLVNVFGVVTLAWAGIGLLLIWSGALSGS